MKECACCLVTIGALLVASPIASAQPTADLRVADLVRAGKLRLALPLPQYVKDPVTGEISGSGTGTITVQIAHALAARLGIEASLLGYPTPSGVVKCLQAGECDIGFLGINPSRSAQVSFAPPHMLVPFTFLVPAGSPFRNIADADKPGVRIAVIRNHESALAVRRILKHAETVDAEMPDAAFELLRNGHADAFASALPPLLGYATKLSGSRVLEDRYGANVHAMAVAKDQPGRLAYISEFIEDVKASGLVQRAIERAGQPGIRAAAPAGAPQ